MAVALRRHKVETNRRIEHNHFLCFKDETGKGRESKGKRKNQIAIMSFGEKTLFLLVK